MAKNRRKKSRNRKNTPVNQARGVASGAPASAGGSPCSLEDARAEVARLIAGDKTKAAVDLAKEAHKQFHSETSEALLVEAYAARIRGMLAKGMGGEARALLDLAKSRHPVAAQVLDGLAVELAARTENLDELLRPLLNPDLPAAERRALEDIVRRNVTNLQTLSDCAVLPPDHPLRQAAHAAWSAFQAVTSGPVTEEAVALPEISRRSPLAPWKSLIRAIACFYRREDASCKRYLSAIDADSPPARIAPVLTAMLTNGKPPAGNQAAKRLMERAGGNHAELRRLLKKAERVVEEILFYEDSPMGVRAVRNAAIAAAKLGPETARRIHRHLWIRGFTEGLYPADLDRAFPEPVLRDSAFWALMAQSYQRESQDRDDFPLAACASWEEFRSQAVHEGLFAEKSPDSAVVYRLMLKIINDIPEHRFKFMRREFFEEYPGPEEFYRGQPKHIREGASKFDIKKPATAYFLHAENLYSRIEAADSSPVLYREWLEWNNKNGTPKQGERIVRDWAKAFPRDAEPFLQLMESAEKRKAYTKALGYLAKAEAIDGLNPKVRRARFRLHLAAFERHVKQKKPHLAEKDLDALEANSPLDGQSRRVIEAALRATLCLVAEDSEAAKKFQKSAALALENELSAELLCWGVAGALGVHHKQLPELTMASGKLGKGVFAPAMAQACAYAKNAGIALRLPSGLSKNLRNDLRDHAGNVDTSHLQSLAEFAIEERDGDITFQAIRAGLQQEGPHLARFLLLRAKTIPRGYPWRRLQCISAAVELARTQRNFDLIDEAVNLMNSDKMLMWTAEPDSKLKVDAQHLQQIIASERAEKKPPANRGDNTRKEKRYYPKCPCGDCANARRGRSRYRPGPFGFDPFEEDFVEGYEEYFEESSPVLEDLLNGWNPFGKDMPKELQVELEKLMERHARRGSSSGTIEQEFVRCMMNYLAKQGRYDPPGDEEDPGEQGDLFDNVPF